MTCATITKTAAVTVAAKKSQCHSFRFVIFTTTMMVILLFQCLSGCQSFILVPSTIKYPNSSGSRRTSSSSSRTSLYMSSSSEEKQQSDRRRRRQSTTSAANSNNTQEVDHGTRRTVHHESNTNLQSHNNNNKEIHDNNNNNNNHYHNSKHNNSSDNNNVNNNNNIIQIPTTTSIIVNTLSIMGLSSAFCLFWSEFSILLTNCSPSILSTPIERSAYISAFVFASGTNLSKIIYGRSMTELLLVDDLDYEDWKRRRSNNRISRSRNGKKSSRCHNSSSIGNTRRNDRDRIRSIERGLFYATEVVVFMAVTTAFGVVVWQYMQGVETVGGDGGQWCQLINE